MAKVNVYLTFNGNCEEAFEFYRSVFGGEFEWMGKFEDMPPQDGVVLTQEDTKRVMHVTLRISEETVLMGSDITSQYGDVTVGNNFSISVNTDSKEEADALFVALSKDGAVIMPMENTFWGAYFGMFTDKFGINWMVNHDVQQ